MASPFCSSDDGGPWRASSSALRPESREHSLSRSPRGELTSRLGSERASVRQFQTGEGSAYATPLSSVAQLDKLLEEVHTEDDRALALATPGHLNSRVPSSERRIFRADCAAPKPPSRRALGADSARCRRSGSNSSSGSSAMANIPGGLDRASSNARLSDSLLPAEVVALQAFLVDAPSCVHPATAAHASGTSFSSLPPPHPSSRTCNGSRHSGSELRGGPRERYQHATNNSVPPLPLGGMPPLKLPSHLRSPSSIDETEAMKPFLEDQLAPQCARLPPNSQPAAAGLAASPAATPAPARGERLHGRVLTSLRKAASDVVTQLKALSSGRSSASSSRQPSGRSTPVPAADTPTSLAAAYRSVDGVLAALPDLSVRTSPSGAPRTRHCSSTVPGLVSSPTAAAGGPRRSPQPPSPLQHRTMPGMTAASAHAAALPTAPAAGNPLYTHDLSAPTGSAAVDMNACAAQVPAWAAPFRLSSMGNLSDPDARGHGCPEGYAGPTSPGTFMDEPAADLLPDMWDLAQAGIDNYGESLTPDDSIGASLTFLSARRRGPAPVVPRSTAQRLQRAGGSSGRAWSSLGYDDSGFALQKANLSVDAGHSAGLLRGADEQQQQQSSMRAAGHRAEQMYVLQELLHTARLSGSMGDTTRARAQQAEQQLRQAGGGTPRHHDSSLGADPLDLSLKEGVLLWSGDEQLASVQATDHNTAGGQGTTQQQQVQQQQQQQQQQQRRGAPQRGAGMDSTCGSIGTRSAASVPSFTWSSTPNANNGGSSTVGLHDTTGFGFMGWQSDGSSRGNPTVSLCPAMPPAPGSRSSLLPNTSTAAADSTGCKVCARSSGTSSAPHAASIGPELAMTWPLVMPTTVPAVLAGGSGAVQGAACPFLLNVRITCGCSCNACSPAAPLPCSTAAIPSPPTGAASPMPKGLSGTAAGRASPVVVGAAPPTVSPSTAAGVGSSPVSVSAMLSGAQLAFMQLHSGCQDVLLRLPLLPAMQLLNVFASSGAAVGPASNLLAAPPAMAAELHGLFADRVEAALTAAAAADTASASASQTTQHGGAASAGGGGSRIAPSAQSYPVHMNETFSLGPAAGDSLTAGSASRSACYPRLNPAEAAAAASEMFRAKGHSSSAKASWRGWTSVPAGPGDIQCHASPLSAATRQELTALRQCSALQPPWAMSARTWAACCTEWRTSMQPLLSDVCYLLLCVPNCFSHGLVEWDANMYCETLARLLAQLERYKLWQTIAVLLEYCTRQGVALLYQGEAVGAASLTPDRVRALLEGALHDEISIKVIGDGAAAGGCKGDLLRLPPTAAAGAGAGDASGRVGAGGSAGGTRARRASFTVPLVVPDGADAATAATLQAWRRRSIDTGPVQFGPTIATAATVYPLPPAMHGAVADAHGSAAGSALLPPVAPAKAHGLRSQASIGRVLSSVLSRLAGGEEPPGSSKAPSPAAVGGARTPDSQASLRTAMTSPRVGGTVAGSPQLTGGMGSPLDTPGQQHPVAAAAAAPPAAAPAGQGMAFGSMIENTAVVLAFAGVMLQSLL